MDGNYSLADIAAATGNGRNNDCVNAADGKLYEYKRDKKKKKLDNVLREMEG